MIGEYNFVVTNLRTHKVIADVNLQSVSWNELYSRPGAGQFTARIVDKTSTPENFQEWENGLWILREGDIQFGGIIQQVQPRAGTGVIQGSIMGFPEYLRHRLIISNASMLEATQNGAQVKWTNEFDFDIAKDLILHAERTNGVGLTAVWAVASPVKSTLSVASWEYKYCGEVFEAFAARDNGFSWWPEYYYAGSGNTELWCRIRMLYPRRGRKTDFRFTFDDQAGVPNNILDVDASATVMPLTGRLGVIGSGEGDAMLRSDITNVAADLQIDYDDTVSYKDVKDRTTLSAKGRYVALQRQLGKGRQFTASMDWNMMPQYTEYVPGDEVKLFIDHGWLQFNGVVTVVAKDITLSETGDPQVKVTLSELSFLDAFGSA